MATRRRNQGSDLGARIAAAIPAAIFAVFIVYYGGLVWALGVSFLGIMCLAELYKLMGRVRPANVAGFISVLALALAALYGDHFQIMLVLVASVPLTFFLTLARPRREHASWATAVVLFGTLWIGVALAHAVLLRELPHGGSLVLAVLLGTFLGDTAAYFGGRAFGRIPLAPNLSPNKTLEGLAFGVVGGTLAFWLFAIGYHDWISGTDALVIGGAVALAAPVGDLFESMIKRDLDVKDTGRLFGAHGGALDRLDAALFAIVTAYYVSVAVL
ncbi:MAG: phosphatidate cytidylyltransferase [Thermoleophilaceae bacterium]|jgi:phosphatidate cytidylyltransferase|nr:phosphatidate cytidylyltransferase [Thermoleophilaceae bacterium]